MRRLFRFGFFAAVTFACGTVRGQLLYNAIDLGTLGGTSSQAFDINNAGQITGVASTATSSHAFLYSGGLMSDLGTLGGTYGSYGYGINQFGDVVGYSTTTGNGANHAFRESGGTMTDLGTLPGTTFSLAYGINSSGQVVGYAQSNVDRAFLSSGGIMVNLGTLGGTGSTSSSGARAINDASQVVGWASLASGNIHAFSYTNGVMSDLGALNGASGYSDAFGINASGQIVGESTSLNNGNFHAFLYSGGAMTDLGTLGGSQSTAYDINAAGQVVGYSLTSTSGTDPEAFLYSGGTMMNLNQVTDLSGTNFATLREAYAINDSGYIVGYGRTTGGAYNAFLLTPISLTPVPEPRLFGAIASVVLLGTITWRRLSPRKVSVDA